MANFAEIDDNNIVLRVVAVADEHQSDGENWCNSVLGGTWKQTSYNTRGNVHSLGGTPFRKNYAIDGSTYDAAKDAFIEPKPYASWTLNNTTCLYSPPITRPDTGNMHTWDESAYQADNSTGWVELIP